MGFIDKIKDVAGNNPDKVDQFTEKAGDAFDAKTGGKFAKQTDMAQEKGGDYLKGGQGEPAGEPAGEGEQPPA